MTAVGAPHVLLSAPTPAAIRAEVSDHLARRSVTLIDNPDQRAVLTQDELERLIGDVDGIIIGPGRIDADALNRAPRLRAISKHGVGLEGIDIEAATRRGIPVTRTPGSNADSVADLTLALLLMLARGLSGTNAERITADSEHRVGRELRDLRLGVLGLGAVGRAVALRALGFGMKVAARAPTQAVRFATDHDIRLRSLSDLLRETDVLVVCVPRVLGTEALIGTAELWAMPAGSYVINVARGGIVDEAALLDALQGGHLAGAGLDVFEFEPVEPHHPLLKQPNVVASAHVGGSTWEAFRRTAMWAADNLCAMLEGERPATLVNDVAGRALDER